MNTLENWKARKAIALRVADILVSQVSDEQVLAVTDARRAEEEAKQKLREVLSEAASQIFDRLRR